jgi:hypothetical protein
MPLLAAVAAYIVVVVIGLATTLTADRSGDEYRGIGFYQAIIEIMFGGWWTQLVAAMTACAVGLWLVLRQGGVERC